MKMGFCILFDEGGCHGRDSLLGTLRTRANHLVIPASVVRAMSDCGECEGGSKQLGPSGLPRGFLVVPQEEHASTISSRPHAFSNMIESWETDWVRGTSL